MLCKGQHYEKLAEAFLFNNGLKLKTKNYHTKRGEIDLIMLDGETLVFVEVRYRKHTHYGTAEETVTTEKQSKIIFSAQHFIAKFNLWHFNARFDVITIKPNSTGQLEYNWLKNAFY